MDKTFLLGVGAQKAGTTWLHRSLAGSDLVDLGRMKEYHIWDTLYCEAFKNWLLPKEVLSKRATGPSIRYRMQNEPGYYASYFNQILASGAQLTGDITPSYAVLAAEDFRKIRQELQSIEARIRVVFLMRDPFERCWSMARMTKQQRNITEPDDAFLGAIHTTKGAVTRTRYDHTVQNLRAAFPETELYFGLYETMHSESELQRLSDFLGVDLSRESVNDIHNASPKVETISPETRATVQSFYRQVYEFCFSEFPATRDHWVI